MATLGIVTGIVIAKSGVTLLARIHGQAGVAITRATLSAITYTVRDLTAATTAAAVALTIADVVFDALQNDQRWTKDSTGYNFRATLPATAFTSFDVGAAAPYPVTPHRYQVDVKFTPATGEVFVQPWQFTPIPVYN